MTDALVSPATSKAGRRLIVAGYACAVAALGFFPLGLGLAGAVIGTMNLTRGRTAHGVAQIVMGMTFGLLGCMFGALDSLAHPERYRWMLPG